MHRPSRCTNNRLTALAILAGAVGCGHEPLGLARDEGAFLQTDSLSYEVGRVSLNSRDGPVDLFGFSLAYEYANASGRLIHILKCDEVNFVLQRRDGERWIDAWVGPDPDFCFPTAVAVPTGETLTGTVRIEGLLPSSPAIDPGLPGNDPRLLGPRFQTTRLTGQFRLVLAAIVYPEGDGEEDRIPVEPGRRTSNPFLLEAR